MTATIEERETDTGTREAEPCWARRKSPEGLTPCSKQAQFQILVTCICEHMKWLPACEEHKNSAVEGVMGCRECKQSGHYAARIVVLMVEPIR